MTDESREQPAAPAEQGEAAAVAAGGMAAPAAEAACSPGEGAPRGPDSAIGSAATGGTPGGPAPAPAGTEDAAEEEHSIYHVVPGRVYVAVLAALLVLTAVTVGVAQIDFGAFNIVVALLIAGTKASIVALYFMHLRWSNRFNAIVFVSGLLFLAIFLAFTMIDTETRSWVAPEFDQRPLVRQGAG
ncbi:MAG: hypothetical protein KatS3mg102_1990 [Planctomycetota bacterium]|nr:MAG: hypothetical protein KatS3mg102_1990 [Planctomycetota bacterium]